MEIQIFLRHLQMVNLYGTPIIYVGATPATLSAVAGTVPQSTFVEYTNDIADSTKIRLAWSEIDYTESSDVAGANGSNIRRSSSGTIKLTNEAYKFVKDWCVDNVAGPLNAVEVLIRTSCGDFEKYKITAEQLRWCEGEFICEFDLTLSQVDPAILCLQKTVVSDNWQGWFQEQPANGKKHPRFSYCNEVRPNSILIAQWLFIAINLPLIMVIFALYLAVLLIINIINIIIGVITTITSFIAGFVGATPTEPEWNAIPEYSIDDFFAGIQQYFVESTGCGREHPAPLIRDYLYNVCAKCGITIDAVTAPLFFSPTWNVDLVTSTGQNLKGQSNPYYNACYFNAPVKRGIRRFRSLNFFSSPDKDDTTFYITDNRVILAGNDFLDQIKGIFNAEWRLKNGKLYFWRKDWYLNGTVLYDFTKNSTDRLKILEGLCFEWNELKYPAYSGGVWSFDPLDSCGNEAMSQMNGLGGEGKVTYGSTDSNPNFYGKDDRHVQLGATKFRLDGASTDYIYDAIQTVVNLSTLGVASTFIIPIMQKLDSWLSQYGNYALLLKDETATSPKILVWDGVDYLNAKAVRNVVPVNNRLVPGDPVPSINLRYNADSSNNFAVENWWVRHVPQSRVLGNALTGAGSTLGIYEARWFFGVLVGNNAARLVNYPMYYEPGYVGTLWDLFHYIDDPRRNPGLNLNFEVKIEACCDDVQRLGLPGDGSTVKLGEKITVDNQYYPQGKIKEIELNIDPDDDLGSWISIKGTL